MTITLERAVYKLALAGEQAGFRLDEMIGMLEAGVSVETLLTLIEVRLRSTVPESSETSGWVM